MSHTFFRAGFKNGFKTLFCVISKSNILFHEHNSTFPCDMWFSLKSIRFVLEEDANRDMANGMTHAVYHQSEIKFFSICDKGSRAIKKTVKKGDIVPFRRTPPLNG